MTIILLMQVTAACNPYRHVRSVSEHQARPRAMYYVYTRAGPCMEEILRTRSEYRRHAAHRIRLI